MISGKMILKDGQARHEVEFCASAYQGLAKSLLPAVITCESLRIHITEDGFISPRKVAILTCDLAQAFYEETEKREWIVELPEKAISE